MAIARLTATPQNRMTTIISLINQKGGCGKSSTCFHLGGQLAADGERVLLIDADPQGSLSQGFFGSQSIERLAPAETLAVAFNSTGPQETMILAVATPFANLDIVRANYHLARYNTPEPETLGLTQYALDSRVSRLTGYDWILIDCPPNLYACSWIALLASDVVLIPTPPEDFGTQGLRAVHEAIESARQLNPRLRRLGHLVTRRDSRLLIHRAYEQKLRRLYDDVFDAVVPEASAFKVALACRKPVAFASPRSNAAKAMSRLCVEIRQGITGGSRQERVA